MKIRVIFITMLACTLLYFACGDSATEITGTLPIVTGIVIDSTASKGDTIVVTWTELTETQIDGYLLWTRINPGNPWILIQTVDNNSAAHIADRSAYYTVMAFYGIDTSSDTGLSANTRTDELSEIRHYSSGEAVGFRIDTDGDSLISGDPASLDFQQQFTVAVDSLGENRYIYPGTAHSLLWPGGAETFVSSTGGFVAPAPDDSTYWQDSISYNGSFFLALDNGYYCRLDASDASPETFIVADTLVIDGELQPIMNVRVFNQDW